MTKYAKQFTEMINRFNEYPEPWDNELKRIMAEQELAIIKNPRRVNYRGTYFSPSSAGSCPRELYMKLKKAKKDYVLKPNHQSQWQKLGTKIGDIVQTDILKIERQYEKLTGEKPPFIPTRTEEGYPFWEEFAQKQMTVEHNGQTFDLIGQPDGVLVSTETGERIGLEVKSKQTRNGVKKLTSADPKHKKQCIIYSIMYGVDSYIITYVSAVKDNWGESAPVVKSFDVKITDEDRKGLLDYFADLVRRSKENDPPALNVEGWTFNNFKTACAKDLSDQEYEDLKQQAKLALKSNVPDFKKQAYLDAWEFITDVREGESA